MQAHTPKEAKHRATKKMSSAFAFVLRHRKLTARRSNHKFGRTIHPQKSVETETQPTRN